MRRRPWKPATVRIDGIEYNVEASAAPHIEKALSSLQSNLEQAEGKAKDAQSEVDKLQAKFDELDKNHQELVEQHKTATDDATVQARVKARVQLEQQASKVLGAEAKFDEKSDADIRTEVIKAKAPELDLEDKSDDYIQARFDAIVEVADKKPESLKKARVAIALNERTDSRRGLFRAPTHGGAHPGCLEAIRKGKLSGARPVKGACMRKSSYPPYLNVERDERFDFNTWTWMYRRVLDQIAILTRDLDFMQVHSQTTETEVDKQQTVENAMMLLNAADALLRGEKLGGRFPASAVPKLVDFLIELRGTDGPDELS